jgi:hypothetical protein
MNHRDIHAHEFLASFMDEQELHDMIESLQKEKEELKPHIRS